MSVLSGPTLGSVPTSRPRRHAVAETPPVEEAPRDRCDAEPRAARERLVREIREQDAEVDVAAAQEVKRLGLLASDR
jgi:hypothetical protein